MFRLTPGYILNKGVGAMRKGKKINSKTDTVIGGLTIFQGTITSTENIRVDGKHDGEISTQGDLYISETGEVKGKVKAENLLIAGLVQGEMAISGKLKILSTGQFQGEAVMSILIIEEGASFQGECQQTDKK